MRVRACCFVFRVPLWQRIMLVAMCVSVLCLISLRMPLAAAAVVVGRDCYGVHAAALCMSPFRLSVAIGLMLRDVVVFAIVIVFSCCMSVA